jgi:hypothetical protein
MARFHDRYAQAISWERKTTPCVRKLVDRSIEKARNMGIIPASSYEYNQTRVCVELDKQHCSYGEWQFL